MTYCDRVSPEIAAKQAEYAARKWDCWVNSKYWSCCFRFHTFREALDYARVQKGASYEQTGSDRDFRFEISGPGGRFDAAALAPLV